jgi:hypothetical protein
MFKLLKEFWEDEAGIFPIIALAAAVIGTGVSVASSIQGTKAAKRAERARRGQEELEQARARLQAIREARIRRAEIAQQAEAQGAATSSGAQGAQASIGTQLQANLGFIATSNRNAATISNAQLQANRAALIGQLGQSFAGLGQSIASFGQAQGQASAANAAIEQTVRVNP